MKIYAVPSHVPIAYLHVEYGDKYIWRPENVDMCEPMGNQTENQENEMKVINAHSRSALERYIQKRRMSLNDRSCVSFFIVAG